MSLFSKNTRSPPGTARWNGISSLFFWLPATHHLLPPTVFLQTGYTSNTLASYFSSCAQPVLLLCTHLIQRNRVLLSLNLQVSKSFQIPIYGQFLW
jgi:hypothetical protein